PLPALAVRHPPRLTALPTRRSSDLAEEDQHIQAAGDTTRPRRNSKGDGGPKEQFHFPDALCQPAGKRDRDGIRHPERSDYPRSLDRKSTRLNSSHVSMSYAVFCLNK